MVGKKAYFKVWLIVTSSNYVRGNNLTLTLALVTFDLDLVTLTLDIKFQKKKTVTLSAL